jgi:hypothetical protein
MSRQDVSYIVGHFKFSETAYRHFADEYKFITILRDPVSRWISQYFYDRYKESKHLKIEEEFEQYLDSHRSRTEGFRYVVSFDGVPEESNTVSEQAIEKAKQNLHKFALIGFLEHLEDFQKKFERLFSVKLKFRKRNPSPVLREYRKSFITDKVRERITEICKPDLEIYRYAIEKFLD